MGAALHFNTVFIKQYIGRGGGQIVCPKMWANINKYFTTKYIKHILQNNVMVMFWTVS